jgi:purine-binding chemotaxis protein CheW
MNIGVGKTERQLVIFDVTNEAFGVDIGTVREIIRMQDITRVPGVPDFVKGVINLRGKVIPVVDLRRKFGFPLAEQTKENRIVVIGVNEQDIGVIVDAVTEVLRIPVESVVPPNSVISTADSEYLIGIAKLDKRLIILLDMAKILSRAETISLSAVLTAAKGTKTTFDRASAKKVPANA